MSQFNLAIDTVLEHEGGFVNNPNDPGGATKYGISLRWLKNQGELVGDLDHDGDIDIDDIKAMHPETAKSIYRLHWWDKYHYGDIDSQSVATKLFDFSVNMGSKQAHKLIQRACHACLYEIADDGILGPQSITTINSLEDKPLMAAFRSEAAGFYRGLVIAHPRLAEFKDGWLKRAYS